jgi:hypothetical protein
MSGWLLLPLRIYLGNDDISLIPLTDGIMVNTELLRKQMNDPSLFWCQIPRKSELIPHVVSLE